MIIAPFVISHRTLTCFEEGLIQENFLKSYSSLSDDKHLVGAIQLLHDISEVTGVPAKISKLDQGDPYLMRVSCYSIWYDDSGVFHRGEEVRVSDRVLKKGFPPHQWEWDFMTYERSDIPKGSLSLVTYLPLTVYPLECEAVHIWWHRETKGVFLPQSVHGNAKAHEEALSPVYRGGKNTGSSGLKSYMTSQRKSDDGIYYDSPSRSHGTAHAPYACAVPKIQPTGHGLRSGPYFGARNRNPNYMRVVMPPSK